MTGYLADEQNRKVGFTVFGDSRKFREELLANRDRVAMLGTLEVFKDRLWLKSPELVPLNWLGHYRPKYPGKTGVIGPELVRDRVLGHLRSAIPVAARFLAHSLAEFGPPARLAELAGLPGWPLETILLQAHAPKSLELGRKAQHALEVLAAYGVILRAKGSQRLTGTGSPVVVGPWEKRAAGISFRLTEEQRQAIIDIITDLAAARPMRRILSGDVGTGKTAVYGTVCAALVDAGRRAVVLLPNESLAAQVAREFRSWWPDLPIGLVTGSTSDTDAELDQPLLVGTTALLHRRLPEPDLMVVDEQQKFSREQREQLVGNDTNLLEVTATCIPRSQALVRYGVVQVSKLTIPHTPKTIHTRIWFRDQWPELFGRVKKTLADGDQVLLVYPLREKGEENEEDDRENGPRRNTPPLRSAEEVYQKWARLYPGRVRWVHGQMSDTDKEDALKALRDGQADILVATTVVEVGINLPKLRRIVIVHPERHGLTTLHQLRGRVARTGGEGWCDLFLPNHVKEKTMERLRVMEQTTDGFKVAEMDMRLRGVGDLSQNSSKQSGSDDTFLFGRQVRLDILDEVMERLS